MNPVTLKQVAYQLGLSASTVSRALRDDASINVQTKQRVKQVAAELRYQPNPHARSLRTRASRTLAVVVPEVSDGFTLLAVRGVEEAADQQGYHVLLYLTHHCASRQANVLRHLAGGLADGVLLTPIDGPAAGLLTSHLPLVCFGPAGVGPGAATLPLPPAGAPPAYDIGQEAARQLVAAIAGQVLAARPLH
ncbi:MAG: LacI family DNA-binding transcriptional regulator [Janthinobacterium lividum]